MHFIKKQKTIQTVNFSKLQFNYIFMRFLLLVTLFVQLSFSQFSRTHYIAPVVGSNQSAATPMLQVLYISSPSITPVNFIIRPVGGAPINGVVSRDIPFQLTIGNGPNTQMHVTENQLNAVQSNKGYIVEATDQVYVAVRITGGQNQGTGAPNQASGMVSKGLAALGREFRIGAMLNTQVQLMQEFHLTFVSVLATENNTLVEFDDFNENITLHNSNVTGADMPSVVLNRGQSYSIAVKGNGTTTASNNANKDGMVGGLVRSDKPIVVSCGSFGGTNGNVQNNLDFGFDQIVSVDQIGSEYIFVRAEGDNVVEKAILVAHFDNTQIFVNGNATPQTTIDAGEYFALEGNFYNAFGNMHVTTSQPVFAYQGLGGTGSQANQELFFVPPISCETPKIIDNIPLIDSIGNFVFTGAVNIVTKSTATLNFVINGAAYTTTSLPPGFNFQGPFQVTGNPEFVSYKLRNLFGNVSVLSTDQVYLSYYGSSGAATYGGYYSGFTFKPEIVYNALNTGVTECIPNIELTVNTLSPFTSYEWFFNDNPVPVATTQNYTPTQPGYYFLRATIDECNSSFNSDIIPVSACPEDSDNDGVIDNLDIDFDNDGISNCSESYGNQAIVVNNATQSGTISVGDYTNNVSTTSTFEGLNATDNFVNFDNLANVFLSTEEGNNVITSVTYNFAEALNIQVEYIDNITTDFLLNPNNEYRIIVPFDKTITVFDPNDQLLVDTNYDGIFQDGVEAYSSFEIRFKLNSSEPLAAGAGTFFFRATQVNALTIQQINLNDLAQAQVSFNVFAACVPKDSDADGVPDYLDLDSDNDGIPDFVEGGAFYISTNGQDDNDNGMIDDYENQNLPIDSDNDGIPDYLDLDSDNDGIYDLVEAGHNGADANNNGRLDGNQAAFGNNGLLNTLETTPNSGILNYTLADTDNDAVFNYLDLDSDGDGCFDVIEAGFEDLDNTGLLGEAPVVVDTNGLVTGYVGYLAPQAAYLIGAPIIINQQPEDVSICFGQNTQFTIDTNNITGYQWQISTDGGATWVNLANNATYSQVNTATLLINQVTLDFENHQYRVQLNNNGNACDVFSDIATIEVFELPELNNNLSFLECDASGTGVVNINLTLFEPQVTSQTELSFDYFLNQNAATNNDQAQKIQNPNTFSTSSQTFWVRATNQNNCFSVTSFTLTVSFNQIPNNFQRVFNACDDLIPGVSTNTDGFTAFTDITAVEADLLDFVSDVTNFEVKYYATLQDAQLQFDAAGNSLEILNLNDFRNTTPNAQNLWVRVQNTTDNSCFGLGPYVRLVVNPVPVIGDLNNDFFCESSGPITIAPQILNANAQFTYQWFLDNTLIAGQAQSQLTVNEAGEYTILVTTQFGCTESRTFTVVYSEAAIVNNVIVNDLQNNNTVQFVVSGLGDYEFALDELGPYQDSPFFDNLSGGFYTAFIRDKNGCGTTTVNFAVMEAPKYFTPNGDGFNDVWQIKGTSQLLNNNAIIYIFDRLGTLIKTLTTFDTGWDGTLNSRPMPSNDYWYVLQLADGRQAKGHFSLIR